MSTNYSFFNVNNRQPIFSSGSSYYPDYRLFPYYSVNNTQVFTYFLLAVTAVTLGYVTVSENSPLAEQSGGTSHPKIHGGNKKNKLNISKKNKKNK